MIIGSGLITKSFIRHFGDDLAELLLNKGYEVHGVKRRSSLFARIASIIFTKIHTKRDGISCCTTGI